MLTPENIVVPALAGDGPLPAVALCPPGARRGVVVLHEIMGPQPEITRVVVRFAAAGYAAIAPDLFAEGGRLPCIASVVRASATGEGRPVRDLARARAWLMARTGLATDTIGLAGFCLTGGFVLAIGQGWPAISSNYGAIPPFERMADLGPVIACYGGRDRIFAPNAEPVRRALTAHGIAHEVRTYPTVGHSFLTDGHHPIGSLLSRAALHVRYDSAVAEDAWDKILGFFDRHLELATPAAPELPER